MFTEAYLEASETSKMEFFAKITINYFHKNAP